jgi:hypothetical protein
MNATLTIEPNVVVRIDGGRTIRVGSSGYWWYEYIGHLIAEGVIFECLEPNNPWSGLKCTYSNDSSIELIDCMVQGATYGVELLQGTVTLDGCTFTNNEWPFRHMGGTFDVNDLSVTGNTHQAVNAGGTTWYQDATWTSAFGLPYEVTDNLYVYYARTLTIEPGVVVRIDGGRTIRVGGQAYWAVDYQGCILANGVAFECMDSNAHWTGLKCGYHPLSSIELTDCMVQGATYGVELSQGMVTLDGCTFTNNEWPFRHMGGTFDVNDLAVTGNTHQAVNAGGTTWSRYQDATWTSAFGLPYEVTDNLYVYYARTLTIEPGVVVRIDGGKTIRAGGQAYWAVDYQGRILANGVTFECMDSNALWTGMKCGYHNLSSIELSNCMIEDAEYGVGLDMGTVELSGCRFTYVGTGIHISSSYSGDDVISNHCSFTTLSNYGVNNMSASIVDARWCYWGHPSGPSGAGSGQGTAVSENVLYEPWWEQPPKLVTITPDLYDLSNVRKAWEGEILPGQKLTGTETTIGFVEAAGLPDTNNPILRQKSPPYSDPHSHATEVASVAVGHSRSMVTSPVEIEDGQGQIFVKAGEPVTFKGVAHGGDFVAQKCDYIWGLTRCLDSMLAEGAELVNISAGIGATKSWSDPYAFEAGEEVADYYIEMHGLPIVVATGNESTRVGQTKEIGNVTSPAGAFNIIAVGAINNTDPNYPVLDRSSSGVKFSPNHGSQGRWRCKPDIVAPGYHVYCALQGTNCVGWQSGTSLAAPQVSGAVAILLQAAQDANVEDGNDPRVIKCVLLNSATKLPGFREPFRAYQEGDDPCDPCDVVWFEYTREYPLDLQQGAGLLNVTGALDQLLGGKHANGIVPLKGWNLGIIPETLSFDIYYLEDVPAGSTIVATLVWYRHLELVWPLWFVEQLSNLDLALFEGAVGVYRSESTIDNVEHLCFTVDQGGSYKIMVEGVSVEHVGGETYSIAWNVIPPHNLVGDFDFSGKVDHFDLSSLTNQWLRVEPPTLSADIIGDGIVNFKDFARLASEWLETEVWYEEP